MKKIVAKYSLVALLLTAALQSVGFGQAQPWYANPSMYVQWTNFTSLPVIEHEYYENWKFAERQKGGEAEIAAIWSGQRTNAVMMIAESTTTPVFRRVGTNYPAHWSNFDVGYTSIATVEWNGSQREFFLGSGAGIFQYDTATEQLETVWPFGWDPVVIADAGKKIAALVPNFGSESGLHVVTTNGIQWVAVQGGMWGLWADPVSGTFDDHYPTKNLFVRMASDSQSIIFCEQTYSTNGGLSYAPIPFPNDSVERWMVDAYVYSAPDVVICLARNSGKNSLLIGKLGGILYPVSTPELPNINTLFYSQQSRLLIVGEENRLFSAVLPEAGDMTPILSIERASIISWEASNANMTLQGASSIHGPWDAVGIPYVTKGNRIEVTIPASSSAEYYRLALP